VTKKRDHATDDEAGVETGQWQDDHEDEPVIDPPEEPEQ